MGRKSSPYSWFADAIAGSSEWVTGAQAARLLCVNPRAVKRFARAGLIGERELDCQARFRRADVVKLAEDCLKGATQSGS